MPQGPLAASIAKNTSNALVPLNADKTGLLLNTHSHGDYYNAAYNGRSFFCANAATAGATLSAALATTYVGLCLSNPAGNTVNLSITKVTGQIIVAPAAVLALGLITGYVAGGVVIHTTPLAPLSNNIGSAYAATGKVDSAATIVGTPAWNRWYATTATATNLPGFFDDVKGSIILPPGAYCCIGANVAGPTAGFVGSFEWEEIAL